MMRTSDDLNDLTSDIHHLSTLIGVVTGRAIDIIDSSKTQCEATKKEVNEVCDLLWIARDMVETIASNSDAAHKRVLVERNATAFRKEGGR